MAKRPPAQKAAESTYRSKFAASVLVRLTKQEAAAIDAKRGELTRPEYLKAKALEGART
jgi:hypothetical protein